jgi:hypothetical protein
VPRRRRCPLGWGRFAHQPTGPVIGDIVDPPGARGHLEIQCPLLAGGERTRTLQQDPQLGIGVRGPDMGQDLALTTVFAHDLNCHRTGGGAHLPHVRHGTNLPA